MQHSSKKKYYCSICHKKFYSQSENVKSAHNRHLGQCLSLRKNTSQQSSSDSNIDGLIDISYQHSDLLDVENFHSQYFDGSGGPSIEYDEDMATIYDEVPVEPVQEAFETFGHDRVMIDATLAGEHILLTKEQKSSPCNTIFDFQQMILQNFDRNEDGNLTKKPINIRSLCVDQTIPRYWEDTVAIFDLWVSLNLSISDGDKILSTFKSICQRNFKAEPQLPVTMNSIVEACKGKDEELFPSKTWLFHLPNKLFGDTGLDGKALKPTTALIRDIGSVIGREMLNVNIENFALVPDIIQSNEDGQRLFGAYSTGTLFENLHNAVNTHAENRNPTESPTVLLALGISSDATTLDKSQSKDGNALQLLLMNVCGKERKPNIIGMIPEKNNAYSGKQLHHLLVRRGFKFKKDRTAIISYVNRKMKLSYISEALSPLLQYQQTGVILKVGSSEEKNCLKIRAYPHVVGILADTLEHNVYAGISMRTKRQCRCCLQTNCNECLIESALGELRDHNHHNESNIHTSWDHSRIDVDLYFQSSW